MKSTYFWKNNEVVELQLELPAALLNTSTMWKYLYCPLVDDKQTVTQYRYGMFVNEGGGSIARTTWHYIPFDDLPHEFKATLLLMGIS